MARKTGRRRRETRRVRLGKALRAELAPLMESHGFRNDPEYWDRGTSPTPKDCWSRRRGGYTDVIHIQWWRGWAPRFAIHAQSDQPGRSEEPFSILYVSPDRLSWLRGGPWFGGYLRFTRPSVRLAARRMVDLIHFLDSGDRGRYVEE